MVYNFILHDVMPQHCKIREEPIQQKIITSQSIHLKVKRIPKSYILSLAASFKIMASHREQIMEKTPKFLIVYAGLTNLTQNLEAR